jgi:UTP-glucose-1-phosphate uridylyltransferase
MIGMQAVGAEELCRVGTARGEPMGSRVFRCTAFIEKPTVAEATEHLVTPGLAEGTWLAHAGIYAFSTQIFDCLTELAHADRADGTEIELAAAQAMLLDRHPDSYLLRLLDGQVHDTGNPPGYARAFAAWRAGMSESA